MKIDDKPFTFALKGICSFARAFTTKRAFQASKQFGECKIWMILKALHCLEEAGFYKSQVVRRAGDSGGVDMAWLCVRPEFLEGKVYGPPVEHGLDLLRKWNPPTMKDKLIKAIATLPAERQKATAARLVALITSSKHCLAVRILPTRAKLQVELFDHCIAQWIRRGLIYVDRDSKGEAIRRTKDWTAAAAFKALDNPVQLLVNAPPLEPERPPVAPLPPAQPDTEITTKRHEVEVLEREVEIQRLERDLEIKTLDERKAELLRKLGRA